MVSIIENEPLTEPTAPVGVCLPTHFILRRIHSLLGVIPLSIFLVIHFIIGATVLSGKASYDGVQSTIARIPLVVPFEILIIVLPLALHAFYGITIAVRSRNNPFFYPFQANWRFTLQRFSGYYLAVFIIIHLYFMWQGVRFTMDGRAEFNESAYDVVHRLLSDPTFMVLHMIAVTAAAFHCANGLLNFCISWGIVIEDKTRRIAAWAAVALFIILAYLGFAVVSAFYSG
jgi:succinate dehydrogenase / fumarate reductase cytochrome b subunit